MSSNEDAKVLKPKFGSSTRAAQSSSPNAEESSSGQLIRADFAARRRSEEKTPVPARLDPATEQLLRGRLDDELVSRHKLRAFTELLEHGVVMVMIDPTRPGVTVPDSMNSHVSLNLNFSLRYGLRDFVYDEQGVRATLSFNKRPVHCVVPWSAVFGLRSVTRDSDPVVWPDDMPSQLRDRLLRQLRSEPQPGDMKLE